jgi:hypothetical protein
VLRNHGLAVATILLQLAGVIALIGCAEPPQLEDGLTVAEIDPTHEAQPEVDLGPVVMVADSATQVAAAVRAAPEDRRDDASVYGYDPAGELVLLRLGSGDLICLADDPTDERFSVACYHRSLEPYMARGRELRAEGVEDTLAVRHEEIDAGTLAMPREPVAVYTLAGELELHDPQTGEVVEERCTRVHAIYTPYATEASTGLPSSPAQPGGPWIMRPGTPSSHIMVVLAPQPPDEPAE